MRPIRAAHAASSLGLVALFCFPTAGAAGTGRLVSSWMSRPPTIDGEIAASEWAAATPVTLSRGITARIGNDGWTLYLAVLDSTTHTLRPHHNVYLHFDDEGGVAPILDDGAFTSRFCSDKPNRGEGVLVFGNDGRVTFEEWTWRDGECRPSQDVTDRLTFAVAARPEGLSYEATIPLDGSMPLAAAAGQRLGIWLRVQRLDGGFSACLPSTCEGLGPADWRNLVLASGGCNTPPRSFSDGVPLDWTVTVPVGTGLGWVQSGVGGLAAACGANITGGSGAALCVGDSGFSSAQGAASLVIPLPPAAAPGARTIRFLVNFQSGRPWTQDVLDFYWQMADGSVPWTLGWYASFGDPAGPGILFETGDMGAANLVLSFYTGGVPTAGGLAQIDDFELICPELP